MNNFQMKIFLKILTVLAVVSTVATSSLPDTFGNEVRLQPFDGRSANLEEILYRLQEFSLSSAGDQGQGPLFDGLRNGLVSFSQIYYFAFQRIYDVLSSNGFNSEGMNQIVSIARNAEMGTFYPIVHALEGIQTGISISQLVSIVNYALVGAVRTLANAQANIEAIIEREDRTGTLLPIIQSIRRDAAYDINSALLPTMNLLSNRM